jgi:hypothetical protein
MDANFKGKHIIFFLDTNIMASTPMQIGIGAVAQIIVAAVAGGLIVFPIDHMADAKLHKFGKSIVVSLLWLVAVLTLSIALVLNVLKDWGALVGTEFVLAILAFGWLLGNK